MMLWCEALGGGGGTIYTSSDFGNLVSTNVDGGEPGLILSQNTSCANT